LPQRHCRPLVASQTIDLPGTESGQAQAIRKRERRGSSRSEMAVPRVCWTGEAGRVVGPRSERFERREQLRAKQRTDTTRRTKLRAAGPLGIDRRGQRQIVSVHRPTDTHSEDSKNVHYMGISRCLIDSFTLKHATVTAGLARSRMKH
jgi:hypothetical protein